MNVRFFLLALVSSYGFEINDFNFQMLVGSTNKFPAAVKFWWVIYSQLGPFVPEVMRWGLGGRGVEFPVARVARDQNKKTKMHLLSSTTTLPVVFPMSAALLQLLPYCKIYWPFDHFIPGFHSFLLSQMANALRSSHLTPKMLQWGQYHKF